MRRRAESFKEIALFGFAGGVRRGRRGVQPPPRLFTQLLLLQQQQQQQLQLLERCLLPPLHSATTRYVQFLLSLTSWVAAGADPPAATAAREIDQQTELELLAATAAATLGGRWSILLKEMMKILERQTTTTTTTTTISAICNSLNPPKNLLTYLLTYLHAVWIMLQNFCNRWSYTLNWINQSILSLSKQTTVAHHRVMALPCPPVPPRPPALSKLFPYGTTQVPNQGRLPVWQVRTASSASSYYPVSNNLGFCSGLQSCPFQLNQIINPCSI